MFNLPPASDPAPNPPVVATRLSVDNVERVNLEPERIVSIPGLNPDWLTTVAELTASLEMK